jgi:hypothetical protein
VLRAVRHDGPSAASASQLAQLLAHRWPVSKGATAAASISVFTRQGVTARQAPWAAAAAPCWALNHLVHATVHVRITPAHQPSCAFAEPSSTPRSWVSRSTAETGSTGLGEEPSHLLVERGLAAHFRLPGGSPAYDALLDDLPQLVAVTPAALGAAVKLLARRLEAEVAALVSWVRV